MLTFITDLGDAARLVPASILLITYLAYLRSTRAAVILVSTLALCAGTTLVLKVGLNACGLDAGTFDLRSPSGHASLSTTFYSCFALMFAVDRGAYTRALLLAGSAALIAAIAISRILIEAHTVSEVALGLLVGLACVGWFGVRYFRHPPLRLPWPPILFGASDVLVATQGWHLSPEDAIRQLAALVRAGIIACT